MQRLATARRVVAVLILTTIFPGPAAIGGAAVSALAAPTIVSFTTVGTQLWTVPVGVTQVTFDVYGAQGGATGEFAGGLGGRATATLAVAPGDKYQINIGGAGQDAFWDTPAPGGFNGGGSGGNSAGGGGGASDIRASGYSLAERVMVAGGGGGTGVSVDEGQSVFLLTGAGGAGGGVAGGDGDGITTGGQGGTQTAAGGGGTGSAVNGGDGSGAIGGTGASAIGCCGGGGGGGGFFAGGGGASSAATPGNVYTRGAGGGGGSGFGPTGTVFQSGVRSGDGSVVVSYTSSSYRPDGMIKRATSTDTFVGNNVYNKTGSKQTRRWTAFPGQGRAFSVKFQNDGNVNDSYLVKGCGSSTGFSVKYFKGATGITSAVTAGTYQTVALNPGGTITITLKIHVTTSAAIDATKGCLVRASSVAQGTEADTPKAALTVVTG